MSEPGSVRVDEPERALAPSQSASRSRRLVYFALGWAFFALGALGALLPVVPTTPFMILALWAFSQSSQRFHDWLYHHRVFGPPLQKWRRYRVIPLAVKATAYAGMLASLTYIALIAKLGWQFVTPVAVLMLVGVLFIARCPTRPPE